MTEGEARRFPKAPLPEGDFTALETGHSGRQGEEDRAHDHFCMGTFKTGAGGRNRYPSRRRRRFQKVPEFASEEELESGPGAAGKHLECL